LTGQRCLEASWDMLAASGWFPKHIEVTGVVRPVLRLRDKAVGTVADLAAAFDDFTGGITEVVTAVTSLSDKIKDRVKGKLPPFSTGYTADSLETDTLCLTDCDHLLAYDTFGTSSIVSGPFDRRRRTRATERSSLRVRRSTKEAPAGFSFYKVAVDVGAIMYETLQQPGILLQIKELEREGILCSVLVSAGAAPIASLFLGGNLSAAAAALDATPTTPSSEQQSGAPPSSKVQACFFPGKTQCSGNVEPIFCEDHVVDGVCVAYPHPSPATANRPG